MDLICLGELLVDMIESKADQGLKSFHMYPGGAAGNVAVGAAKLGLKTGVISKVGDDLVGNYIIQTMESNSVDCSRILKDPEHNSTLTIVSIDQNRIPSYLFYRENAASLFMSSSEIDEAYIAKSKAIYFSSIFLTCPTLRKVNHEVVRLAKRHRLLIAFDPNIRIRLWESEEKAHREILQIATDVDILKLNADELHFLFGHGELVPLGERVMERFPRLKLLVVTLGKEGAFFMDSNCAAAFTPAFPAEVLDTTGAGDSFFSALLHYWLSRGAVQGERELEQLGSYANAAAYLTATRHGAIPALPTQEELCALLEKKMPSA